MSRSSLVLLAFFLFVAGGVLALMAYSRQQRVVSGSTSVPESADKAATTTPPADWLSEYTLTERSGGRFQSKDLAGKVHVVNFFFSKCPTVCRTQTGVVQSLAREFGPQGVVFLSITCDPDHDTAPVLASYAQEFQADPQQWLFLTGDLPLLRRVGAEMYYLAVDKESHSESLVVLDKWGQIRSRVTWKDGKEVAEMKTLLTSLLAEKERPVLKQ